MIGRQATVVLLAFLLTVTSLVCLGIIAVSAMKKDRVVDPLHVETTRLCQEQMNQRCACSITELDVVCKYPRKGAE